MHQTYYMYVDCMYGISMQRIVYGVVNDHKDNVAIQKVGSWLYLCIYFRLRITINEGGVWFL